jgi:hypothetical protein
MRIMGNSLIDGGGGGDVVPTSGNTGSLSSISEDIRLILALKDIDPDLAAAWEAFNNDKLDEMYAAIYRSKFYKNNTATARQRQASKQTQPGAYNTQLDDWKIKTRKRLTSAGVKVTSAVEAQLEAAYLLGMSDDQLDSVLANKGLTGQLGGETGTTLNTLQAYARSFGVDNLYNKAYWDQASQDLFKGTTTEDDIKASIRSLAASTYPAFAEDLMAGKSLDSQGAYITQTLSSVLERPITASSPEARRFLQYINPENNKAEKPPQWLVEKEAKKLPGWDYTDNARASIDSLSLRVLKDMGLM